MEKLDWIELIIAQFFVDDIDEMIPNTNELIKKTGYNTEITNTEKKIPSLTGLVTTAAFNTEATEIETLSPNITNT